MMEFLHRSAEDRSIECEQGYIIYLWKEEKKKFLFYRIEFRKFFIDLSSNETTRKWKNRGKVGF